MSSQITPRMNDWVVEIEKKLSKNKSTRKKEVEYVSDPSRNNIYKLNDAIREKLSESDYAPRIVSFGPYYNGRPSYKRTEEMKENVFLHFLNKSNKSLEDYILALKDDVQDLKKKYVDLDQQNDDDFLRLMILDGCFLLELLREVCNSLEADRSYRKYEYDDPVWHKDGRNMIEIRADYIHDMLLLENQIPLMVIYKLCGVEINDYWKAIKQVNDDIHKLPSPFPSAPKEVRLGTEHVLDLYWHRLRFGDYTRLVRVKSMISYFKSACFKAEPDMEFLFNIPSAAELNEVGIGLITDKNMTLMDVSFSGGTLWLPQIFLDGLTKSIFLNIIAYEQVHMVDQKKPVTSYIYFMSRLLRDTDDVKLLVSRGIIHSVLSRDEIVKIFGNLTNKDIVRDPNGFLVSNYESTSRNLSKRFNKLSNEWRKDLWQKYLKSPFAIGSVIVAFLLFSLSAIQTVYTVLGYYNTK